MPCPRHSLKLRLAKKMQNYTKSISDKRIYRSDSFINSNNITIESIPSFPNQIDRNKTHTHTRSPNPARQHRISTA